MKKIWKKVIVALVPLFILVSLTACGDKKESDHKADKDKAQTTKTTTTKPKSEFTKGENVILHTNHMPGMDGAKAVVEEVKYTKYYEVNYTDTKTGKEIKNHKWVAVDEIKDTPKNLKAGDHVVLEATHMSGMKGARATIVAVHEGYLYAVNYHPTNDESKEIKDHKWVAADEMSKA